MRRALALAALALVVAQPAAADSVSRGRALFVEGCSSCHGFDARGVAGQGPSLVGAGAAAADFYLSTGRMPLDAPGRQPLRPLADVSQLHDHHDARGPLAWG